MVKVTENSSSRKQETQRSIYDFTQKQMNKENEDFVNVTRCDQIKEETEVNCKFANDSPRAAKVEPIIKSEPLNETNGTSADSKTTVKVDLETSLLFQTPNFDQDLLEDPRESISHESNIFCPVCELDISSLDIREKTDHVDTCLVRVTFVDERPKIKATTLILNKRLPLPKEKNVGATNGKKRKTEKEKRRYINIETNTEKKIKIIKPPAATAGSSVSRRNEISALKTMTFPVDKKLGSTYQVSVDAFALHHTL